MSIDRSHYVPWDEAVSRHMLALGKLLRECNLLLNAWIGAPTDDPVLREHAAELSAEIDMLIGVALLVQDDDEFMQGVRTAVTEIKEGYRGTPFRDLKRKPR